MFSLYNANKRTSYGDKEEIPAAQRDTLLYAFDNILQKRQFVFQ
jgi:hypothetical protein